MLDFLGERFTGRPVPRPQLLTGEGLLLQPNSSLPRQREVGLGHFLAGQNPDKDSQVPVPALRPERAEQGDVLQQLVVLVVVQLA